MSESSSHPKALEISTLAGFVHRFAIQTAVATVQEIVVRDLDLRGPNLTKTIVDQTWSRVAFHDCRFDDHARRHVLATGATVE